MTRVRIVLFIITTFITLSSAHFTAMGFDGIDYFNILFPVVLLLVILLFDEVSTVKSEQNFNRLIVVNAKTTFRFMKTINEQSNTIAELKIKIKELED